MYTNNFNKESFSPGIPTGKSSSPASKFGRVLDIILDASHPQYRNKGGAKSINGVFFRYESTDSSEDTADQLRFAYQGNGTIKVVPVIGELVKLESRPTSRTSSLSGKLVNYYTAVVNIWNHPNSNTYLDVYSNPTLDISKGGEFIQESTINPIQSAMGDIQIEGRQGQSVRFTGAKGKANPWIDDSNLGAPMMIFSNGQVTTEDGFTTITEDINEDASSIYMVSNHQIPLVQASEKRDAYKREPVKADQYKGNQVIISGGRLVFNAKADDILLLSTESIGLNTEGSINLDAKEYLALDAPAIYLGKEALTAPKTSIEAVLLGNQTEIFLQQLLNMLERMAKDMATAITADGKPIPKINKRGIQMQPVIKVLRNQININGASKLKSKKVFTS